MVETGAEEQFVAASVLPLPGVAENLGWLKLCLRLK